MAINYVASFWKLSSIDLFNSGPVPSGPAKLGHKWPELVAPDPPTSSPAVVKNRIRILDPFWGLLFGPRNKESDRHCLAKYCSGGQPLRHAIQDPGPHPDL